MKTVPSVSVVPMLLFLLTSAPSAPAAQLEAEGDFAQAAMMLEVFRLASSRPVPGSKIDAVLASPGTQLIIRQQNISRTVTTTQYRALLSALHQNTIPMLTAVDGSERAQRGLEGLQNDVWPALRWGVAHVDFLARKIEELKKYEVSDAARRIAAQFLPDAAPCRNSSPYCYGRTSRSQHH
jgi:hypothetical protein